MKGHRQSSPVPVNELLSSFEDDAGQPLKSLTSCGETINEVLLLSANG